MKNFSDLNNDKINESNSIEEKTFYSIKEEIQNLIDNNLTIEIEGEEKPWEKNFKIKAEEKFYEQIQNIINKTFYKEKVEILEKAKQSFFTKDYQWIDEEVDKIKESLNNERND